MNPDTALSRLVPSSLFLPLSLSVLLLAGCGSGGGGGDEPPLDDPDVQTIGCTDSTSMDLFAAETNSALGLSWNNHANFNADGGYRVRYGTATGTYTVDVPVAGCTTLDCETTLTGLDNTITYYIVVDALNASKLPTGTSCEVAATPHILTFSTDIPVQTSTAKQSTPSIASSWDGTPLFMGWIENNKFVLSRSDDYGITWSAASTVLLSGTVQSNLNLTFRRRVTQTNATTGELEIIVNPALFATIVVDGSVKIMRGDFPVDAKGKPVYPLGALTFSTALDLGAGDFPATAAYADHIEVAYENTNGIWVRSSANGGVSFLATQRVDKATGGQLSAKPDVSIDPNSGDVFVAYEGNHVGGDTDVYLNYSTDNGVSYQVAEVRIDDDTKGANQRNISISTDPRTSHVMATWEDSRSGKDVYFSRSTNGGSVWETNLDSGNGLAGDQFQPVADVDPGRNVFVLFIDTSNGHRPLFNRFNALGVFETPKEVSAVAGTSGAVAKDPALTIDKFGRVYVAWSENRDGPVDNIFFARGQ